MVRIHRLVLSAMRHGFSSLPHTIDAIFNGLMPQNFAAHFVRPDDSRQRADEDCFEIEYFDARLGRRF